MEQHIVELETRLSFQENLIQELNTVITDQQQQIDILRAEIRLLKNRINELAQPQTMNPADEPPPPHY